MSSKLNLAANPRAQLNSCGAKVLGISFANDNDARALGESLGAVELLDKTKLAKELIPAIVRLAEENPNLPRSTAAEAFGDSR